MPISKIKTSSITADAASVNLNIDANTLFLDATNNRVGIGTASPTYQLQVKSSNGVIASESTGNVATTGTAFLSLHDADGQAAYLGYGGDGAGVMALWNRKNGATLFATNNTERVRIDSSGNLGIGTTSPQSLLDLTGNDPTLRFTDNAGSPASTFSIRSTDGTLRFRDVTNSLDRVTINSSGNVGIGVSTVATNFRTQFLGTTGSNTSAASSGTTQAASAVLRLQAGGGFTATLDIGQGGGTGSWLQSCDTGNLATTYPLLLNPVGGNVGIATTNATRLLEVGTGAVTKTAIGQSLICLSANSGNAGYVNEIGFGGSGTTNVQSAIGNIVTDATAASNGALYFATRSVTTDTAPTEKMRITSAGNVGIATSSPAASLDVATSSGSAGQVNTHIMLSRGTSTGAFLQTERAAASNNVSALILGVNSAERMRITDAGFVGINNNAPGLPLDVTGQIRGTTVLVLNAGTPTTPGNTTPTFFSPSSGVLGLVNNGSESFRVASNGNVGIGTSVPAHKLSLEGGVTSYTYFLATLIGPTHLSGSAVGIGFKPEPGSNTRVKGGLVYEGNGEGYDFGDFHFLQRRTTDSQAADLNNKVVTITSHGNVGIGTSAPDNNGGYKALTISSTTGAQIYFKSTNSSVTAYVGADNNGGYLATLTTHTLRFRTNNVDRMTINSDGAVSITGSLSKGSGSFRIEHPLPEKSTTHELVHSFIEGPQADLIYRGKVNLVAGTATVNIDTASGMTQGTFEVLCRDVQCFTTNESDWTAVRGSVTGNILTIEAQDNTSTASISWMVIGERKDKHMYDTGWTDDDGKVIVEPLKVEPEEIPPAETE